MINKKALTQNLINKISIPLVEHTLKDLSSRVDAKTKNKASSMVAYYEKIEQKPDGNARTIWKVPSQTDKTRNYQVNIDIHVPIGGSLFAVAKGKWKPKQFSEAIAKSDVKVFCNCPDFHWGGVMWRLGPNGDIKDSLAPGKKSSYGNRDPLSIPPDIRDPDRVHALCKHLTVAFSVFPANAFNIMSDARKYDAEINPNPALTNELDEEPTKEKITETAVEEDLAAPLIDAISKAAIDINEQKAEGADEIIDTENEPVETEEPEQTEVSDVIDDVNEPAKSPDDQGDDADELIDQTNEFKQQSEPEVIEEPDVSLITEPTEPAEETPEDNADELIDEKNDIAKKISS